MQIAINGFGRIGRGLLRAVYESGMREHFAVVAINELADLATIAHLLKYDSVHGRFAGQVSVVADGLQIEYAQYSDHVKVSHCCAPAQLQWHDLALDLVLDASGALTAEDFAPVLQANNQLRLMFSRPMLAGEVDATLVYGLNAHTLKASDRLISAGSCTTHALLPVISVLDAEFGIEFGSSTTLHSMMNDQPVLDAYHHTNLRKTRAASHSMIPVRTELAKGVARLMPHLDQRFSAQAVRVPTLNVSAIDLCATLARDASVAQVNAALKAASERLPEGVLAYTEEPLASCDFNHCPDSSIIDAGQTRMSGPRLLKVWIWFDNEWAYVQRLLDLMQVVQRVAR